MLSPADRALALRDPALPGLQVVLDREALSELVGCPVTPRYLRYKPATSCVVAARMATGDDVLVTAYAVAGEAKAVKTVMTAPGAVLARDTTRLLLATRASADRDLPALARLADLDTCRRLLRRLLDEPGRDDVQLSTLAYKPHRRWVGLAHVGERDVVLRSYRRRDAARAAEALQQLHRTGPPTPALLGQDLRVGLLAVQHLPGSDLAHALATGAAGALQVRAAGAALAALHTSGASRLPGRLAADDIAAVQAAADHVAVLLPHLAAAAHRLAEQLSRELADLPAVRCALHGDFSLDQVVLQGPGLSLIDLDRAAVGHPAADLGSAAAALAVAGPSDVDGSRRLLEAIEQGYQQVAPLPAAHARAVHTAAALLQRAVEPFRTRRADWPDEVRLLVEAAHHALPPRPGAVSPPGLGPLEHSPVSLLVPLLGEAVELHVLKDKPGRRRTSRATGPRGTAIVKVYASDRAPVVAARLAALSDGPHEPVVPRVLLCDAARHTIVLTEVPGRPFTAALLGRDLAAVDRVGRALAAWHAHHRSRPLPGLRHHTAAVEGRLLLERAESAPEDIAQAVRAAVPALLAEWECDTLVHRDLYEEQIVLGELVGLIDLDDVALGPAELDVGNLIAHLHLFGSRHAVPTAPLLDRLLAAYTALAPLDLDLLERCRRLSLLRLACLHADLALVPAPGDGSGACTIGVIGANGH